MSGDKKSAEISGEKKSPEYELAVRKVDAIIGFRIHFVVYLGVNLLLLLINVILIASLGTKGPDGKHLPFIGYFWCMWPITCWGFGVFMHYLAVRKFNAQSLVSWKEQQIQKFMGSAVEKK